MSDSRQFKLKKHTIDIAFVTDKGGRPYNEDAAAVHADGRNKILCAVADGLGAHGGGDIAAGAAVNAAREEFSRVRRLSVKTIRRIFNKMNESVLSHQTDMIKMKTTFAGIFIKGSAICTANIGDTRVYSFSQGELSGVTVDHSRSYEEVMGAGGTLDDIRFHPNRHILNAAVGVEVMRSPDIYFNKLSIGQAYLICSDGFWEYVNEDAMLDALNKSDSAQEWLDEMMRVYNENALEWNDNYSAVCIKVTNVLT